MTKHERFLLHIARTRAKPIRERKPKPPKRHRVKLARPPTMFLGVALLNALVALAGMESRERRTKDVEVPRG